MAWLDQLKANQFVGMREKTKSIIHDLKISLKGWLVLSGIQEMVSSVPTQLFRTFLVSTTQNNYICMTFTHCHQTKQLT